jgi:hypothetical protein
VESVSSASSRRKVAQFIQTILRTTRAGNFFFQAEMKLDSHVCEGDGLAIPEQRPLGWTEGLPSQSIRVNSQSQSSSWSRS